MNPDTHHHLHPRAARHGLALAASAAALILLAGCAAGPKRGPAPEPLPAGRPAPSEPVVTRPVEPEQPVYKGPWEDPSSPLYNRTIYFDYDSAEIDPGYIAVMRTHAGYLGQNPGRRVTLEGHTDERGSRDYNLALGDLRADAVRRFMTAEGVSPDQMATLSYGEERPAATGHSEAAWRKNRRVIIQY
jgi:peptidoglycan-associated lipoprotein